MANTTKTEYSKPDGFHVGHRLERKARPAGRLQSLIAAELEELEVDDSEQDDFDRWSMEIMEMNAEDEDEDICYCRRCYLHDDPAGCLWA